MKGTDTMSTENGCERIGLRHELGCEFKPSAPICVKIYMPASKFTRFSARLMVSGARLFHRPEPLPVSLPHRKKTKKIEQP
jgi:hypothetical protein